MENQKKGAPNAKAKATNEIIENEVAREKKYLFDYKNLTKDGQKKERGKVRRRLMKFSSDFFVLNKKGDTKGITALKKEFKDWVKVTYIKPTISVDNLKTFYEGNDAQKIEDITNLIKGMA